MHCLATEQTSKSQEKESKNLNFINRLADSPSDGRVLDELVDKHRGRYKPTKPWLEPSPEQVAEPEAPPNVQIEDNLRSLEDKTIFTGLYAAIAKQNNTICFSRKESIDMRAECIQNISQRISSEYRITDRKDHDDWEPVLAFYEEDEDRPWMDKEVPITPGATGLDVEEWSKMAGLH
ncbi:hypothetical protein ACEPPN_007384 [Leptodophora sp. 'Broadleaf-Isolate-01']